MGSISNMGNPAGVKRDFGALEKRRYEAIRLLEKQDLNQSEVARRVQVCDQTVSRWAEQAREGGREILKGGRPGRKPEMTDDDRHRLQELLMEGPEKLGYETPLWTCSRVAHLIENEFDIEYHPGHVWKILVDLGWSCQRPERRARERNEEAIRYWRRVTWPDVKKRRKKRDARSSSSTKAE
jgi:transposase